MTCTSTKDNPPESGQTIQKFLKNKKGGLINAFCHSFIVHGVCVGNAKMVRMVHVDSNGGKNNKIIL